ncbi:MAG: glycosyltransferase family 87 protein [Terracidiphilus sp.]
MTKARRVALTWMLLCCGLSALWGFSMFRGSPGLMVDFKGVYFHAQCLLQHADPYKPGNTLRIYLAKGEKLPQSNEGPLQNLTLDVYLPTTSIFVVPLALLPWWTAQTLWTILGIASLIFAAFLMWDLAASYAPVISGVLICFVLANTEAFFPIGNPAAIAISLCLVGLWCFLRDRFVWAGVLCLAISLVLKPQDAGFVWLFLLLAGGVYRKRALQTLLIAAVLGLAAIACVTPIAPHWTQELHSNLQVASAPGGVNDPGPTGRNTGGPASVIDFQSVVAVFRNDSRIYNSVSYLVCGALLLMWVVRTLRVHFSQTRAWLALAAVVPLSMLVTYHRIGDTKLLLLAVPACAMLWAEGKPIRWLALLITSAGLVFTADIPLTIHLILTRNLHISAAELPGQLLTVVLMRPTQLTLLAMGIFYLWIYLRYEPERA